MYVEKAVLLGRGSKIQVSLTRQIPNKLILLHTEPDLEHVNLKDRK